MTAVRSPDGAAAPSRGSVRRLVTEELVMGTCGFGRVSGSGVRPGRGHMQEAPAGHTRPVGGFDTLANGSCPFRRRRVWRPALPLSTRIALKLVGPPPVPGGSTASSDLAVVASSPEFESALSASGALRLPRLDQAGFPSGVSPVRDLSESTDGLRLDPRGPRFPPPDFHYSPGPPETQELSFGARSRWLPIMASAAMARGGVGDSPTPDTVDSRTAPRHDFADSE